MAMVLLLLALNQNGGTFGIEFVHGRKTPSFDEFGIKLLWAILEEHGSLKEVDDIFPMCNVGILETIMHRFWNCWIARKA